MLRLLINLTIVLGLTACSQVQVTDYQDMQPAFKVEQFFEGQLTAHGVVKNRGGKVIRTFDATIAVKQQRNVAKRRKQHHSLPSQL